MWFAAPISIPSSTIVQDHVNPMIKWDAIDLGDGTSLRIRLGGWVSGLYITMNRTGKLHPGSELARMSKDASWRRMYLSSHEYVVYGVEVKDYEGMPHKKADQKMHSPTAGQLFDAVFRKAYTEGESEKGRASEG